MTFNRGRYSPGLRIDAESLTCLLETHYYPPLHTYYAQSLSKDGGLGGGTPYGLNPCTTTVSSMVC